MIKYLPNIITTANLFCGFYSILQSHIGNYSLAAWLIILGGLFDLLDGRVARLIKAVNPFGMLFDSLSDLTTFCLAPAILIFHWSLFGFGIYGVLACFLFFACGAFRLARFNIQDNKQKKADFKGLPSTAACGILVSYVIFYRSITHLELNPSFLVYTLTVFSGLLMVSHVRFPSFKRINRNDSVFLGFLIALVIITAIFPTIMFFMLSIIYVILGTVENFMYESKKCPPPKKQYLSHPSFIPRFS